MELKQLLDCLVELLKFQRNGRIPQTSGTLESRMHLIYTQEVSRTELFRREQRRFGIQLTRNVKQKLSRSSRRTRRMTRTRTA